MILSNGSSKRKCQIVLEGNGMERIDSASNAKIKWAASLHQRKERKHRGEFVAEGVRLAEMAVASGWPLRFCIATETALVNKRVQRIVVELESKGCPIYVVSPNIYKKASATESPQGILLVMESVQITLAELSAKNNSLVIVLDRIQDPGNVGTIIRTADAAGFTGVLFSPECADLFSPKVLRATMGSIFRLGFSFPASLPEALEQYKKDGYSVLSSQLDGSPVDERQDVASSVILIIGNEGNGVSDAVKAVATHRLCLPMRGGAESLNAAVAAGIMMYDLTR